MSDYSASPARPVSLFTIVFLLALFAAFLLVIRYFYRPATSMPYAIAAENYPKEKDAEWRANSENRRKTLEEQRAAQLKQLSSYGWADQKAGKVNLPIERAMELTAQQYGAKR
jgi:cbb3-type cytochrome oxidase subunit 3